MENNNLNNQSEYSEDKKARRKISKKVGTTLIALSLNVAVVSAGFATGFLFGDKIGDANMVVAENAAEEVEKVENQRKEISTQEIAKLVGPSVVGIISEMTVTDYFWGIGGTSESSGSGIIFKKDGGYYYILTNNHVVEDAVKVSIQIAGDATYEGEIVGTDANTDLAVVKISTNDELTVAKFGDSSKVEVGEKAIAIGNPLGMEFFGSITQGIISATNRKVKMSDNLTMNYIQTDAAINSGNSGGALVNAYGEVIGVNSAKISSSSVEGMGFAIPITEASVVAEDLVKYGYVKGRPVIGITSVDVTASVAKRYGWPEGVWVNSVTDGSGAKEAGLMRGDIIIEADGKKISSTTELNEIKNKYKPGDNLRLKVYRENRGELTLKVRLSEDNPLNSK